MFKKNYTRRQFISHSGAALSSLAAAPLITSCAGNRMSGSPEEEYSLKYSMYLYTLANAPHPIPELDIVDICKRTKAMGIDGLDFIGAGYNRSWPEIKQIVDDHGLEVVCYTRGVGLMESPDAATRQKGIEEFKDRLETAHILGTSKIMMNQSGKSTGNGSDTNRKWIIESLKEALPLATAAGIEVTIETHNSEEAPFRTSAHFSEALAVLPNLRVCFDTGNSFNNGEDPLQGYLNNKEHVTHMHFKDFNGTLGNKKGMPCVPGTGAVDLPSIIQAMKDNGYKGYIHLEKRGPDGFKVYEESMALLNPYIA